MAITSEFENGLMAVDISFKKFRIELTQAGDYQLCFDNSFSYQTRKVVFFGALNMLNQSSQEILSELYLYDAEGNLEEEDITKFSNKKLDPQLQEKMKELGMTIQQFHVSPLKITLSHFEKFRNRSTKSKRS